MRYQEFQPPQDLAQWVKCFWIFEHSSTGGLPETIVADGFPELIVHFGDPYFEMDHAGALTVQARVVVSGQLTKPLVLHTSANAGMIGIRFQPAGMAMFTEAQLRLLVDKPVAAHGFFSGVDKLLADVTVSSNEGERIEVCHKFLRRSFRRDFNIDVIETAVRSIQQTQGEISIVELARSASMSRRGFEVAFVRAVGVTPKMLCRINRFRSLFDRMADPASRNWCELAQVAGFFDQSHLIRDFREFTGNSPQSYLANQTPLANAINQPSRKET